MKFPVTECPPFYRHYVALVQGELKDDLKSQLDEYVTYVRSIPEDKFLHKYGPDKWTVKEVIGHNTDTERIKSTAAFRIARNDDASIPGFDEDQYVLATDFNSRSMESLVEEFIAVRKSTIALYDSLSEEELARIGVASGKEVSARVVFYFLVGHVRHHQNLLKERYGL